MVINKYNNNKNIQIDSSEYSFNHSMFTMLELISNFLIVQQKKVVEKSKWKILINNILIEIQTVTQGLHTTSICCRLCKQHAKLCACMDKICIERDKKNAIARDPGHCLNVFLIYSIPKTHS